MCWIIGFVNDHSEDFFVGYLVDVYAVDDNNIHYSKLHKIKI